MGTPIRVTAIAFGSATVVMAAIATGSGATGPPGTLQISASPALYPRFDPGVSDYVSRCLPKKPLSFSVNAPPGTTVSVGRRAPRTGKFGVKLPRSRGTAVGLTVHSPKGTATYHVRCLPLDFPRWDVQRRGEPQAQWYIVGPIDNGTSGYAAIFDSHGVPVWWRYSSRYGPWDVKLLPSGHLAWTRYIGDPFGMQRAEAYEERSLDGRLVRTVRAIGHPTDTHDLQQMANGHYLVVVYRRRQHVDLRQSGGPRDATVYDGEIQELTPAGKRVWSWNSRNHIRLSETTGGRWWRWMLRDVGKKPGAPTYYDLVHINSVEPDRDGFVVSARHLDAVFRIDKHTGRVTWKLGGTPRPESLKALGTPPGQPPLAGQHDARLYRDGTLTVYDNNTATTWPPRAVRYRIDTKARTATLLEDIEGDPGMRSRYIGSARKLPGGNWVVSWGGYPIVTEKTPAGSLVLSLDFGGDRDSYRAVPVAPGRLSAGELRRAMDRMHPAP